MRKESISNFDELLSNISYLNSDEIKSEILNEVNKFSKDFTKIIKKIKKNEKDLFLSLF